MSSNNSNSNNNDDYNFSWSWAPGAIGEGQEPPARKSSMTRTELRGRGPITVSADSFVSDSRMFGNHVISLSNNTTDTLNPHFDENKFTGFEWMIINRYLHNNNSSGNGGNFKNVWDIVPFKQRLGEPRMYEPEVPIIYLNRAYMHCTFQHVEKPKIQHTFPRPFLDNRLMRKTKRIVLTIDANSHAQYNIWGIDYRTEPTFQFSLPRNAFTLHLIR